MGIENLPDYNRVRSGMYWLRVYLFGGIYWPRECRASRKLESPNTFCLILSESERDKPSPSYIHTDVCASGRSQCTVRPSLLDVQKQSSESSGVLEALKTNFSFESAGVKIGDCRFERVENSTGLHVRHPCEIYL